jgi:hypothetical protein
VTSFAIGNLREEAEIASGKQFTMSIRNSKRENDKPTQPRTEEKVLRMADS